MPPPARTAFAISRWNTRACEPLAQRFDEYRRLERDLTTARELAAERDAEARALGEEEGRALGAQLESQEGELQEAAGAEAIRAMTATSILEVRAGTGGDEAALFAGDLLRMYARYAEGQRLARRRS